MPVGREPDGCQGDLVVGEVEDEIGAPQHAVAEVVRVRRGPPVSPIIMGAMFLNTKQACVGAVQSSEAPRSREHGLWEHEVGRLHAQCRAASIAQFKDDLGRVVLAGVAGYDVVRQRVVVPGAAHVGDSIRKVVREVRKGLGRADVDIQGQVVGPDGAHAGATTGGAVDAGEGNAEGMLALVTAVRREPDEVAGEPGPVDGAEQEAARGALGIVEPDAVGGCCGPAGRNKAVDKVGVHTVRVPVGRSVEAEAEHAHPAVSRRDEAHGEVMQLDVADHQPVGEIGAREVRTVGGSGVEFGVLPVLRPIGPGPGRVEAAPRAGRGGIAILAMTVAFMMAIMPAVVMIAMLMIAIMTAIFMIAILVMAIIMMAVVMMAVLVMAVMTAVVMTVVVAIFMVAVVLGIVMTAVIMAVITTVVAMVLPRGTLAGLGVGHPRVAGQGRDGEEEFLARGADRDVHDIGEAGSCGRVMVVGRMVRAVRGVFAVAREGNEHVGGGGAGDPENAEGEGGEASAERHEGLVARSEVASEQVSIAMDDGCSGRGGNDYGQHRHDQSASRRRNKITNTGKTSDDGGQARNSKIQDGRKDENSK